MMTDLKRRSRDDPRVRRAQILDEAISIVGERGYYGFAIQELAQRCGLTNAGLLYHFRTKETLLLAILDEYERRMEVSLQARFGDAPVPFAGHSPVTRATARTLMRAIVELSVAQPQLMLLDTVLRAESLHHGHPGHEAFCRREAMIIGKFAEAVQAHCDDPQATARHIYALMSGLEHQWLRSGQGFDLLAEWDRAIDRILPEEEGR